MGVWLKFPVKEVLAERVSVKRRVEPVGMFGEKDLLGEVVNRVVPGKRRLEIRRAVLFRYGVYRPSLIRTP